MQQYELRYVEWIDSAGTGSWRALKEHAEAAPKLIRTIGWVLRDDADSLVIAQSIDDLNQEEVPYADNSICIPRVAIREERRVSSPRGRKK
jgi:hypothetical protein